MKILDTEGRLFGKINIVDISIILLFLVVIPVFFHIHTILGKRPTMVPYKWIKVEAVTFTIPEIAEFFKEGDISYDANGNPEAKLLKIDKKGDAYGNRLKSAIIDKGDNEKYAYTIPVFLEFELSCTFSTSRKNWYYQRTPLIIGLRNNFCFNTDKYTIDCYALKIGD